MFRSMCHITLILTSMATTISAPAYAGGASQANAQMSVEIASLNMEMAAVSARTQSQMANDPMLNLPNIGMLLSFTYNNSFSIPLFSFLSSR
jgi:hypothetical protein